MVSSPPVFSHYISQNVTLMQFLSFCPFAPLLFIFQCHPLSLSPFLSYSTVHYLPQKHFKKDSHEAKLEMKKVNGVFSGLQFDYLSIGVSGWKIKDENHFLMWTCLVESRCRLMSLLNPNGLPDRQLIKTTVLGALQNAGHWCSSLSKSSFSIMKKLRTFRLQLVFCCQPNY